MRIGIDAHFLEKHYGGLTTFLKGILKEIPEIDKSNEYFLFFRSRKPARLTINYPITQLPNYPITKYHFTLWFNFVLPRQLKEYNIDLFFSPNHFLPLPFNSFRVNSSGQAFKTVVVIHDLAWKINPEWKNPSFRVYAELFQKKAIQRADKIIVDSESTRRDVMKYYRDSMVNSVGASVDNSIEKKIEVVYLAAEERFKPRITTNYPSSVAVPLLRRTGKSNYEYTNLRKIKKKHSLPEDFILYVGRIEKRKNIQGIIEIAKEISKLDRFKELKFILFGPIGPGGNQFLDIIRNAKNIQYKGVAEEKDLPYIYNLAKIFLFPSFYEGFGIPPLEAMQSGLPVLTSNTSSLPEVLGQGGLMHDPKDYEGFAKDITRLLEENEFYQEMRKKGIEQAKNFSWRKSAEKLVTMFNGI